MEQSYEQLNTEYVETRKVSSSVKYTAIFIALIFSFTPLPEFIYEFDYNNIEPYTVINGCITGYDLNPSPLEFRELKIIE